MSRNTYTIDGHSNMQPQQYLPKELPHRKRDTALESRPVLPHAQQWERMRLLYWPGFVPLSTIPGVLLVACTESQPAAQMAGRPLDNTSGSAKTEDGLSSGQLTREKMYYGSNMLNECPQNTMGKSIQETPRHNPIFISHLWT
jgi:hypothetical protein